MDKRSLIFICAFTLAIFFVHQWFNSKNGTPQTASRPVEQVQKATQAAPLHAPPVRSSLSEESTEGAQYYVLENQYQQLVFSSHGGALAEINLLLASKGKAT